MFCGLPEENSITTVNGSINANYRFDDFTVTSITGISHFDTTRLSAYDQTLPQGGITPAAALQNEKAATKEVREEVGSFGD